MPPSAPPAADGHRANAPLDRLARGRQKTGGDWIRTTLTASIDGQPSIASAEPALAIEQALTKLERTAQRATRVIELRYLTGLWPGQIAEPPGLTRRTIGRDWRHARAFLHAALEGCPDCAGFIVLSPRPPSA
ncbi:MAG: ECF-type sigma factor [Lysobacterales bacterium]